MEKTTNTMDIRKVLAILIGTLIALLVIPFLLEFTFSSSKYEENFRKEDQLMFATYNKDYINKTDKNSRQIILEVKGEDAEKYNTAIINYLSNVGGELTSVNSYQISKDTINPVLGVGLTGDSTKMGVGFISGVDMENNNRYILKVPPESKIADNLSERLKAYFRFGYKKY